MSQAPPGLVFSSAPTPGQPPSPSVDAATTAEQAILYFQGILREIRAEAQSLNESTARHREKASQATSENRAGEVASVLENSRKVVDRNRHRIDTLLTSVRELLGKYPSIYDWCSDEIVHVENCWEQVNACCPEEDQSADQLLDRLERAGHALDRMIYLCGRLTVPSRVNQHLQTLRVGQALDFHKQFRDELKSESDRVRLLGYMADHPYVVSGIVDVQGGVIYHASAKAWRRGLSSVMLLGTLLLGVAMIFVTTNWLDVNEWPLAGRFDELVSAYVFLVAGAIAHTLVESLKQARHDASSGLVAVKDWMLWLHVKESSLMIGILYLWIGLLGLAFTMAEVAWVTAFFVGYAIDSFVDLFLGRFAQAATQWTDARAEIDA